jgi:hypothetical protein
MAQRATVDVSLRADISNLVDNLSKVEGLTKAQARKMVRQVERSYKDQTKAAKATAEAQIKASKGVGKQSKKTAEDTLDVAQKFATEIAGTFGFGFLGDVEGLFDAARTSSERFGVGSVAAFAGIAGAAALGVAALVQYTEKQQALNREVAGFAEELEGFVGSETLQALQSFNKEITAIDKTAERLKAETLLGASDEAERFEQQALGLTQIGLPKWLASISDGFDMGAKGANDSARAFGDAAGGLQGLATALGDVSRAQVTYTKGQAGLAKQQEFSAERSVERAEAEEKATEEAAKAAEVAAELTRKTVEEAQAKADLVFQTEMLADRERKEYAAAMKSAEQKEEQARIIKDVARLEALQASALGELMSQEEKAVQKAAARVEEMTNLSKSLGDNADATLGLAAASEALEQAQKDQEAALQTEKFEKLSDTISAAAGHMLELTDSMSTFANLALDKLTEIADKERARQEAAIESDAARKKASIEQQLESGKIDDKQAEARMRNVDRLAEADKRRIEGLTDQQKKQAKKAFAAQQALALAEVAINAAAAYLPLVGGLAYLGFGAPAAAAGITGAAALAQTAAILSAKPPEFASGGMVGARLSADHALIAAQPDEGIVSRRGIAALGGPDGLDQLNRGAGMGASITANIMLDRQMLGRVVAEVAPSARNTAPGRVQIYGGH